MESKAPPGGGGDNEVPKALAVCIEPKVKPFTS